MDLRELEVTLEAALAVSRPTTRDVRDALVDYYAAVARPFIERGLQHTHPEADDALIRRIMMMRLGRLWGDLGSAWEKPTLEDLSRLRARIDKYACVKDDAPLLKARRLLDDLMLSAAVSERLRSVKARKPMRRLKLIEGGGEISEPRGQLRIVRESAVG